MTDVDAKEVHRTSHEGPFLNTFHKDTVLHPKGHREKGHRGKGLAELKDALHSLDFRAAEDTVGKVTKSKV